MRLATRVVHAIELLVFCERWGHRVVHGLAWQRARFAAVSHPVLVACLPAFHPRLLKIGVAGLAHDVDLAIGTVLHLP